MTIGTQQQCCCVDEDVPYACCFPPEIPVNPEQCVNVLPGPCAAGGGVPDFLQRLCSHPDVDCLRQACCCDPPNSIFGDCVHGDAEECVDAGCTPQGVGTSCSDPSIECPDNVLGACCVQSPFTCDLDQCFGPHTVDVCEDQLGGVFLPGETCAAGLCNSICDTNINCQCCPATYTIGASAFSTVDGCNGIGGSCIATKGQGCAWFCDCTDMYCAGTISCSDCKPFAAGGCNPVPGSVPEGRVLCNFSKIGSANVPDGDGGTYNVWTVEMDLVWTKTLPNGDCSGSCGNCLCGILGRALHDPATCKPECPQGPYTIVGGNCDSQTIGT